jgi:hypothetical protein
MGMSTPHHAREWFTAAALRVCHEYRSTLQYKPKERAVELLKDTLEIDVHAKLSAFFGTTSNIFAQGRGDIDVRVRAPRLDAEVKFLVNKRNSYAEVFKDWTGLVSINNTNDKFARQAWVVFLPKKDWFTFLDCQSVERPSGTNYTWAKIAPFLPFAEPFLEPTWNYERMRWRDTVARLSVVLLPQGKKVRVDVVGEPKDHLWAVIYTRITPDEHEALKTFAKIDVDARTISPIDREFE